MPELPEVETIVRGLGKTLPGKTIQNITVFHKKPVVLYGPKKFQTLFTGQTFEKIERHGKFLFFRLRSGMSLVVHLRMTGKFIMTQNFRPKADPHIRLAFHLSDTTFLLYKDLRLFGTFRVYKPGEIPKEFVGLGRDPVKEKIDTDWFLAACSKRKIAIKTLLLDQRVIAGLGNIYACEALFRARINPFQKANTLGRAQARLLLNEIRSVLLLAIKHNGTSIRDFKNVDEMSGKFQNLLQVYGRENEPCNMCGTPIERVKQAQRSTFHCAHCQLDQSSS